ncbi:MAG: LamG domain-containing protein [Candidatus Altiarchaeota archaeon]|nr:LamG domain-containing protein [Candidatus Altiarchaeota archaeon]
MNKGYIYTAISIIFAMMLLAIVSLYHESYKNTGQMEPVKIRTEELHYFVESSKKDIKRAMTISGSRAAVYLIDHVVNTSAPLSDPQESLKELIINGTITTGSQTRNVTHMQNHTLTAWLAGMRRAGGRARFDVNITLLDVDIYAYDAWSFLEIITLNYLIKDEKGLCSYEKYNVKLYSLIPIDGLEDPAYPLNTANMVKRRYVKNNASEVAQLIATGSNGNGTGSGIVFDISAETDQDAALLAYAAAHPELLNQTLYVMNISDLDAEISAPAQAALTESGGVINYRPCALDRRGFPYIANVSTLINNSNASHLIIKNGEEHQILKITLMDDLEHKSYRNSTNGSSFFDRLEGNMNTTEKYINQSKYIRSLFGQDPETPMGLTGFVNVSEFEKYKLYDLGILTPYTNQSSADHLYFQNTSGKRIYGTPGWFRLDAKNIRYFNLTQFYYTPNLSAAWHLDEEAGNVIYDGSRHSNNGVAYDVARVDGKSGRALSFDGAGSYVDCGNDETLQLDGDLTICFWLKPNDLGNGRQNPLDKSYGGEFAFTLEDDPDAGSLSYYHGTDRSGGNYWGWTAFDSGTLKDDIWQHICISRNSATKYLASYLNGNIKKFTTYSSDTNKLPSKSSYPVYIGKGYSVPYNGLIDDVKIWGRPLSDDEILGEYELLQ